jgi:tetratricopeptide (TPR) repeat protein
MLIDYADWLLARQALGRSEVILREGLRVHGRELPLLSRLGFLYFSQRHLDRAEHIATWLIALGPDTAPGFLLQARIDSMHGRLEEALLMYEEAKQKATEEELVPIALEMMRVLVRGRQWDRFEAVASEIRLASQAKRASQAEYYRILASREVLRGKPYDALEALEKAEGAMPLSADIAMEKGQIFASLGALDRASSEYRKALKVDPSRRAAQQALQKLESAATPQLVP